VLSARRVLYPQSQFLYRIKAATLSLETDMIQRRNIVLYDFYLIAISLYNPISYLQKDGTEFFDDNVMPQFTVGTASVEQ
jgi:hypothetical protein